MEAINSQFIIDRNQVSGKVSDTLFGIFLEDINYSCDGGLNANMLRNYSFDDVYMKGKNLNMLRFVTKTAGRIKVIPDRLRYWKCTGGNITSSRDRPVSMDGWYASVHSDGVCVISNKGYNGEKHDNPAIAIKENEQYEFSCYIRNQGFIGKAEVGVQDRSGNNLTQFKQLELSDEWSVQRLQLHGNKTAVGQFILRLEGKGDIDIDCLTFQNADTWGKNNPKWSQGKMRKDLVLALKELKPTFMRFPGGCLVEGIEDGNEYQWKNSVGPIIERHQDYNLWATESVDSGYIQSRQLGFYEFFLLCEDLNMEPLPIVWAGLNCQMRKRGKISIDAPDFYERVVQNALDLIEYANGDPKTSKWARLRADAGHPDPFHLKFLGIGNENIGEDYFQRFSMVKAAIDEKFPGITCILSAGGMGQGKDFDAAWKFAKEKCPDVYIDEHLYKKPSSYIESDKRYDNYDRNTAKVFLGEYAAFDILNQKLIPNQYDTALAEAAFLTGIEKNSDVVKMTCYAPLFALINGEQWKHNMIYYNPLYLVKSINYYVQQMYGTTIGKEILKINQEIPEAIRMSVTADDERIVLKIVNVTSEEQTISFSIKNFQCKSKKVTLLTSDSLTSRNTLGFDGKPQYQVQPTAFESQTDGTENMRIKPFSFYVIELVGKIRD